MNMPDVNDKQIGVRLPLELVAKVRRVAEAMGTSMAFVVQAALVEHLHGVQLNEEDYDWIKSEVRKNKEKRNG